jgi:multidrug resistance efflux pump
MPTNDSHISLRSDEVQEIMSHVPHWMIRWGITLIFFLIGLLIFTSWFIKYPDVIKGQVTVSTTNPPTKLLSKSSGQLTSLYFKDGVDVQKGDVIATIDNSLSSDARDYLNSICSQIRMKLESDIQSIEFNDENYHFGSVHQTYIELKTTVLEYQNHLENDVIQFNISSIQEQIGNYTLLKSVSHQQLKTTQKELENAQEKFRTSKKLYEENVISKVQLYQEEQQLIQVENAVGNTKKETVQNSITITNLKRELNDLKKERNSTRTQFVQRINLTLRNIQNSIDQWSMTYQIVAPKDGKLTYLKTIHENEYVSIETPLFAVISENQNYVGYVDVPTSGYGKVKVGQKVRTQIDKYPYEEFGQLDGTVTAISLLPNENVYRVQFTFSNGLTSTYGNTFEYSSEMSGKADIITEDVRLISRIFNKFKKVFDQ